MSQATSPVRWTIQDIEALPDHEGIRYEIIDGVLFVPRSPHYQQQQVAGRIFAAPEFEKLLSRLILRSAKSHPRQLLLSLRI